MVGQVWLMQYYQIHVNPGSFSNLTPQEQEELKQYEKNMVKVLKNFKK